MPEIQRPNSDVQRLRALNAAMAKANVTPPGTLAFSPDTLARLATVRPQFAQEMQERGSALSAQAAATAMADPARRNLNRFIRHFIAVFNMGVDRGRYPATDRGHYQLPVDYSRLPRLVTDQENMQWADNIITGDAARVAAGGDPMENPSAAEVAAALTALQTALGVQSPAKDAYDKEQEDVENMRAEVDDLIDDLWDQVLFTFRKDTPPSMRRKAYEYGIVYRLSKGEQPTPEEFSAMGTVSVILPDGTQGPLPDVLITDAATGTTAITNGEGFYLMPLLPDGDRSFTFSKDGYQPQTRSMTAVAGQIIELNVTMQYQVPPPPPPMP